MPTRARECGRRGPSRTRAAIAGVFVLGASIGVPGQAGASDDSGPFPDDTSTSVGWVMTQTSPLQAVDPGAEPLMPPAGFGGTTTGGAGGQELHVTSAADSITSPAPGTLRHALSTPGPKWIVFDSDFRIQFQGPMNVPSNTTIDGRGHDVTLTGHGVAGLHLYDTDNVVIENLTFQDFGDVSRTAQNDQADAIDIQRSSRVWIDHCTLSHVGDKLISVEEGGRGLTISWNHFYDQEQTVQIGAMMTAMQDVSSTVTMYDNYFDHVGYRLPLVLYGKAHVYNNYMDEWTVSGVRSERLAQVYLEDNFFRVGGSQRATTVTPAQACNDAHTLCDPRDGYLADTGNTYVGDAQLQSTGTSHVFKPQTAYTYGARTADEAMANDIETRAGVVVGPGSTSTSGGFARLKGRNTRWGNDLLRLRTGTVPAVDALISIYRHSGTRWIRVKVTRLSRYGRTTVRVKDRRHRRVSKYRIKVHATPQTPTLRSNVFSMR